MDPSCVLKVPHRFAGVSGCAAVLPREQLARDAHVGERSFHRRRYADSGVGITTNLPPGRRLELLFQERLTRRFFQGQKRSNVMHEPTTDPDGRLFHKSCGKEAYLAYRDYALMMNRNSLIASASATMEAALLYTRARC